MEISARDPRRGPPLEHAQAHPAVPGARLRGAAVRPSAADPQRRPHEDEQAQEPDRASPTTSRRGSSARRSSTTSRSSGGRPAPRTRSSRSTSSSSGSTSTRSTRAAPSSIASGSSGSTASGSAGSTRTSSIERLRPFVEAGAGGRPHRPDADATTSSAPCCPSSRNGCRRSARSATSSGFLWVEDLTLDPAILVPKRWDAATTTRRR